MAPIEGVTQLQVGIDSCAQRRYGAQQVSGRQHTARVREAARCSGGRRPQGDITTARTAAAVIAHFDGQQADLVVSDGAPDGALPSSVYPPLKRWAGKSLGLAGAWGCCPALSVL